MIALFDIDNTLAAAWHRDHLIEAEGWDAFHAAAVEDQPIQEMVELLSALDTAGWHIVLLTGRNEKWRNATMAWLVVNGVAVHELLMRPDEDYRPNADLKLALINERWPDLKPQDAIIFEDHEKTAEAWRALGFTTLLVTAYNR